MFWKTFLTLFVGIYVYQLYKFRFVLNEPPNAIEKWLGSGFGIAIVGALFGASFGWIIIKLF